MAKHLSYILLLSALVLPASPAAAQYAPWCFIEGGNRGSGATSCTFYSFAQCEATRIGIGGVCQPNPYTAYGAPRPGEGRTQPRRRDPRY